MIVAGDIGNENSLALFDGKNDRVDPVRPESFHSADYTSLEDMLTEFLVPPKPPTPIDDTRPRRVTPPSRNRSVQRKYR